MGGNIGSSQEESLCKFSVKKSKYISKKCNYFCGETSTILILICANLFFSESEEGEVWYYSTPLQFEELISTLDKNEMEVALYRELSDYKEEIVRQMEITETLTNQIKGNKKSYLEVENSK